MKLLALVSCLVLVAGCRGPALSVSGAGIDMSITRGRDAVATVRAGAQPRPHIWPIYAPGGVAVTRDHPMGERAGEQHDHPHHQSLWFAHGNVNGFDFWHSKKHRERIVHHATRSAQEGGTAAVEGDAVEIESDGAVEVESDYTWEVEDGDVVLEETRTLRFEEHADHRTIDATITLRAAAAEVTFGDTKEGSFALRLHPALRVEGKVAAGILRNSEGHVGKAAWGKRARWLHDQGPIDGQAVGVAIFDHPGNLRHPTWWHARTYGLVAANPFGVHDFERKPKGAGDYTMKMGEELTLRYRVVVHRGAWAAARVEEAWRHWAR